MAWTVTSQGGQIEASGSGSSVLCATSAFTPATGDIICAAVNTQGGDDVTGVTADGSWGITFEQVAAEVVAGDGEDLELWAGFVTGGSPASSNVTANWSSDAGWGHCIQLAGGDVSGTVAAAFIQNGDESAKDAKTSLTITPQLNVWTSAGNLCLTVGRLATNSIAFTAVTGFTALYDADHTFSRAGSYYKTSEERDPSVVYDTMDFQWTSMLAVEIAIETAGGGAALSPSIIHSFARARSANY